MRNLSFEEETAAIEGVMFLKAEMLIAQAKYAISNGVDLSDSEWGKDARKWLNSMDNLRERWRRS